MLQFREHVLEGVPILALLTIMPRGGYNYLKTRACRGRLRISHDGYSVYILNFAVDNCLESATK